MGKFRMYLGLNYKVVCKKLMNLKRKNLSLIKNFMGPSGCKSILISPKIIYPKRVQKLISSYEGFGGVPSFDSVVLTLDSHGDCQDITNPPLTFLKVSY